MISQGHNAYSSVIIKQIIDKAQSYSGINNPISTGVKESVAFCTAAANCKECGILTDGGITIEDPILGKRVWKNQKN